MQEKLKVMGVFFILMEIYISENGVMIKLMEQENIMLEMEQFMMANGKMI